MPSERLIKAVLSNVDAWLLNLDEIFEHAIPGNKSRILHLKLNMLQAKVSFLRLVDAPPEDVEAAMRQANREWPEP